MFSAISLSRWIGLSEGKDAILLDSASKPFLLDGLRNQIDLPSQDSFETLAQPLDPPEICKAASPRFVREADNHIHVGLGPVLITGNRADQRQAGYACLLE